MSQTPNNLAAYIWGLADLLRGDFKQSQYGRIILPFTLLRRRVQARPEAAQEKLLIRATDGLSFYNTSKIELSLAGKAYGLTA